MTSEASAAVRVPRLAIEFCTQCKWNLRAAYVSLPTVVSACSCGLMKGRVKITRPIVRRHHAHLDSVQYAQELLQTFGTSVGEVALLPATGGTFVITMTHVPINAAEMVSGQSESNAKSVTQTLIWDRKIDGGFPETKELKNRVRNIIQPDRDLGHIDRSLKKASSRPSTEPEPKSVDTQAGADLVAGSKDAKNCEDCK
jgi:predicted Rdx family selenoprotein